MQDAQAAKFDLVLTESLDRISRDQEDIAGSLQAPALCRREDLHTLGGRDRRTAYRLHGHDECALSQGPGGKDAAGTERARPGRKIGRRQLLWL